MPPIEYVLATEKDIDILVHYRMEFGYELNGRHSEDIELTVQQSVRSFLEAELNKSYFSWYAKVDERVAGLGGMSLRTVPGNFRNPTGKWAYIMCMYTVPEFRRMGISSSILNRLVGTGREMGITAFELHATEAGEPVYKKNGFLIHNEPTYRKFILT